MHEFGTTSEQLAWIKVAASHHASHNPRAMLRDIVTVKDVIGSPMVSDPLQFENATESVRIHGAYGYSKEFDAERLYRDAPLLP